eukprot:scaffold48_cov311-Ochromonas_danica.AAC.2
MAQQQPVYDIPKELTYESITAFCPSAKVESRQIPLNGAGPFTQGTVISVQLGQKQRSFANPATLVQLVLTFWAEDSDILKMLL